MVTRRMNAPSSQSFEGGMPERFQLAEDRLVDEAASRRKSIGLGAQRNAGMEHGHLPLVAGHHGHVAGLIERGHQAGGGDLGHFGIVRLILSQSRHVLHRAVGVMGEHSHLLMRMTLHRPLQRIHADAIQAWDLVACRKACPERSTAAGAGIRARRAASR